MDQAQPATAQTPRKGLPLEGVTVLDLGQIYNGPYAGFLMAMGGARVIKIEPPAGENMRRRGAAGSGAMFPFAMLNSNKEFLTINLKTEEGRALLRSLVAKADILIENFAPGVMDKLGVGPQRLFQENPRLVYAAGSGYGWSGPYRDYLAMDLTVQAMSGVMASTGFPDSPPVRTGAALCDFLGGIHLYSAAVTKLFDAQRTGKGGFVEVAMLEAVYATLASPLGLYQELGQQNPPRTGNRHAGLSESPYNVYPTSDGWMAMFCVTEGHFQGLAAAMERPDLLTDPRFNSHQARVANMDAMDAAISEWSVRHTKDELHAIAGRHRVPCAPVRELDEVVNDPHMHERGALRRVDHPDFGEIVLPTGPLRYGNVPAPDIRPSKAIGADTASVLADVLGLDPAAIAALVAAGAV